jgi:transmembrane sensor
MNKITEQQFYDLLSLKLSGDALPSELALLQEQLLLHPQWQFLYDQMMQPPAPRTDEERTEQAFAAHFVKMQLQGKLDSGIHTPIGYSSAPENPDTPGSDYQIEAYSASKKVYYRKLIFGGLAAAVVIGIVFLAVFHRQQNTSSVALSEIATRKGSKSNIKLPDGTEVWLNADSKLSYPENFVGSTREVTLTGEAYFDVMHDTAHPFIIHAGKARILVLGTAFNVRNYPQEKSIETTLMRGKIEVSFTDRPNEQMILKPLEKLIVEKEPDSISSAADKHTADLHPSEKVVLTSVTYSATDSIIAETSWVNDKMVFVNEPLEKIAEELERHFAVTIIFKNPVVKAYRYTGVFSNESIDKIFQILELSKKINYVIRDKTVIIE